MTNTSFCHSERFGVRPWALGGEPSGAVSRTKENQVVQSGESYLIFRNLSVVTTCEAHVALTFGLLWGQAKSDRKRFIADALNDKRQCNTSTIKHLNKKQSLIQACSFLIGGASFFPTLCFFYSVQ